MKQYFTGFFTAVCLTASVFIFMGSKNKNLGDIKVSSISIVPGKYGGGFIKTYNEDGKQTYEAIVMGTDYESTTCGNHPKFKTPNINNFILKLYKFCILACKINLVKHAAAPFTSKTPGRVFYR